MRLFLDSSVLLAASGSDRGASRAVIDLAPDSGWALVSSIYCRTETLRNLHKAGPAAEIAFRESVEPGIDFRPVQVAVGSPLVFPVVKDRPVVVTALAEKCAALLTLDRADFHRRLGRQVYGMQIRTPGEWLREVLGG